MAHQILYEHFPKPTDPFKTFRVLWEPYTNRVSLRFRNYCESANGLVGTPEEALSYLDMRARTGPPWNSEAPREARRRLSMLVQEEDATRIQEN